MARRLDHILVIDVEATCWQGKPRRGKAARLLGLPLNGMHHRAGDDASNIAAILAALLRRARHAADR